MRKFILFAICSTILIGSAAQALRFGPPPTIKIPDRTLVKFLPSRNEALEKALEVHNLMTELPALLVMTVLRTVGGSSERHEIDSILLQPENG